MDMQMYNLIKNAMKEGKSIEDVISEVNTMAETAKKEIQPQAPLLEKYGKLFPGTRYMQIDLNSDGTFNKDEIICVLARYYVQNGFNPDPCFDTEKEFLEAITSLTDNGFNALKLSEKLCTLKKQDASDEQLATRALSETMDLFFKELFNSKD